MRRLCDVCPLAAHPQNRVRILEHPKIVDVLPDPLPPLGPRSNPLVILYRRFIVRDEVDVPPEEQAQRNDQRECDDYRNRL